MSIGEVKPPPFAPSCDVCGRDAVGQVEALEDQKVWFLCGRCFPANYESLPYRLWDYHEFMTEEDI